MKQGSYRILADKRSLSTFSLPAKMEAFCQAGNGHALQMAEKSSWLYCRVSLTPVGELWPRS